VVERIQAKHQLQQSKRILAKSTLSRQKETSQQLTMRSFSKHITEAPQKPYSACDILSQPNEKTFFFLWRKYRGTLLYPKGFDNDVDESGARFIMDINQWLTQEGFDKSKFITRLKKTIDGCPNRGAWTYYTGKVYRGVFKDIDGANLKLEPNIIKFSSNDGVRESVVGTATYVSKYDMQSWTTDTRIAFNFAEWGIGTRGYKPSDNTLKLPLMMETNLTKDDSFLNPSWSGLLSSAPSSPLGESEVVRLSNKPIQVKVYIGVYTIFKSVSQKYAAAHSNDDLNNMTVERAEKFIYKTLTGIGGEPFAKFLLKRTMTNLLPPDLMKEYKG
jgi:hypothetical protein